MTARKNQYTDASEVEKHHRLSASKRYKLIRKYTYYGMMVSALLIIVLVIWAYLFDTV